MNCGRDPKPVELFLRAARDMPKKVRWGGGSN